jgi:hypothetical protein
MLLEFAPLRFDLVVELGLDLDIGSLLEAVEVPQERRDHVTAERMADEDQRTPLHASHIQRLDLLGDGVVHFVIDRVAPIARLLIGGGVAQALNQQAAQFIVGDAAGGARPGHEVALMIAHGAGPEHRLKVDEMVQVGRQKLAQRVLHRLGKADVIGEDAMHEDDGDVLRHAGGRNSEATGTGDLSKPASLI